MLPTGPLSRIRWLLILLLLVYWSICLHNLADVPQVNGDEPWLASAAWKLVTTGVFGSDMFSGLQRMDVRSYGFMPVQPLTVALLLRLSGLGLFPARFASVIMGMLTLALTFSLGKRLFSAAVGITAVALLLLWRTATLSPMFVSGILFVDVARIARYDIFVPVFGLTALHVYISASRQGGYWRFLLAGALAALSALANVYGAFWLAVLFILLLWNRDGWRSIFCLLAGAAIAWLPYALYIGQDIPAWKGQLLVYPARYQLLSWRWYLLNIVNEPYRYQPGLGGDYWSLLTRPGLWLLLLAVPLSLIALTVRALWRRDWAARMLLTAAVLLPLLFAVLLFSKFINYLVMITPVWALVLAWGGVAAWQWAQTRPYPLIRPLLILTALLILLEGGSRQRVLWQAHQTIQPYRPFINQVRPLIPDDGRVLGLHTYWLGLEDLDYRSWFVPMALHRTASPTSPISVPKALTAVAPTVILIDDAVRGMMAAEPVISAWMTDQDFELKGVVEDETYGRMEIWVQR